MKNEDIAKIIDGKTENFESFIKPNKLPQVEEMQSGFTIECFIKQNRKFGVRHIISNGGSFHESGYSILCGHNNGGIIRGELQNIETKEKVLTALVIGAVGGLANRCCPGRSEGGAPEPLERIV